MLGFEMEKIDAKFELLSIAVERTYLTGVIVDGNGKKLADVQYNWTNPNFDHPRVVFSVWGKDSGWTKLYNGYDPDDPVEYKNNPKQWWFIHNCVKKGLISEGIISMKQAPKKQPAQTSEQQTKSSAPKPQQQVSEIVKVKVSQAKQQQKEVTLPKPQKAEGIKMMTDEELAAEIHKISDFEDNFVDPDLL